MADDIIANKAETIAKCLRRIAEEYQSNSDNLKNNITKQDAIILNLERACQASIDMAMRAVRLKKLGIPKESRDAFIMLKDAGFIADELCQEMLGLVGFRKTSVHNYKKLDLAIVEAVITDHLKYLEELGQILLRLPEN